MASGTKSAGLLALPAELVSEIAMKTGFFGAMSMKSSCRGLYWILSSELAWRGYSKAKLIKDPSGKEFLGSVDSLDTTVTISTHLHSFDHLHFGIWNDATADSEVNPTLYFEHMTFHERYDYLGGVKFRLSKSGKISTDYFDHREMLPCYIRDVHQRTVEGQLPPVLDAGALLLNNQDGLQVFNGQVGGRRVDHSCKECSHHDSKLLIKDLFIYEEIAKNALWQVDGFWWSYAFPDGRIVNIHIVQDSAFGTSMKEDLPLIEEAELKVGGRKLSYQQKKVFHSIVKD